MSRKRCRRRIVTPLPPPGLRPRLASGQVRDLGLVHIETLDAIAGGTAGEQQLWDFVGAALTWSRAAEFSGLGVDEMAEQLELAKRLVERFKRTGRVLFDGPDYQLAKTGQLVMDELARRVDRPAAIAAADWSEAEINRRAAALQAAETAS
jgi:hypothetical protein